MEASLGSSAAEHPRLAATTVSQVKMLVSSALVSQMYYTKIALIFVVYGSALTFFLMGALGGRGGVTTV